MLGNIPRTSRQWLLRCPDCGAEWVSDVHRDEYYGWEVEQEYCPDCDEPGVVIDNEIDRDAAADAAYDRMVEERAERSERRSID
jgi:hypothetical protein